MLSGMCNVTQSISLLGTDTFTHSAIRLIIWSIRTLGWYFKYQISVQQLSWSGLRHLRVESSKVSYRAPVLRWSYVHSLALLLNV